MKVRKHRYGLLLWLGLLALIASAVAQNDLSRNVLDAALTQTQDRESAHAGGHYMPDGTWMAGGMGDVAHCDDHTDPAKNDGHSHKGHSDCVLCGPLAAMALFTQSPPVVLSLPNARAITAYRLAERDIVLATVWAPYASRAPPRRQA
jgi:hypothetical protein